MPLCFGLTFVRKLLTRAPAPGPATVRSILFVKLAEQGSTVLAYPALQRAVQMVGKENVYYICFEENRFILDLLEVIPRENVITISAKSMATLSISTFAAMRRMWNLKLDAAIDMEFFARGSAAITFLSGAKSRVGFHSLYGAGPYRGDLMTHRLLYNPHLHTTSMFQVLVESLKVDPAQLPTLGFKPPPSENCFPTVHGAGQEEIASVKALIPQSTVEKPVILLNPNASDLLPLRQWPRQRYLELARRLLERFPEVQIGFTGAPNEAEPISTLVREIGSPRCVVFAGKTSLRQLMVLYTVCEILVTNEQRAGALCLTHRYQCGDAVRSGNTPFIRRANAAQRRFMGGAFVQPVRQCLQQPAIELPQ